MNCLSSAVNDQHRFKGLRNVGPVDLKYDCDQTKCCQIFKANRGGNRENIFFTFLKCYHSAVLFVAVVDITVVERNVTDLFSWQY